MGQANDEWMEEKELVFITQCFRYQQADLWKFSSSSPRNCSPAMFK